MLQRIIYLLASFQLIPSCINASEQPLSPRSQIQVAMNHIRTLHPDILKTAITQFLGQWDEKPSLNYAEKFSLSIASAHENDSKKFMEATQALFTFDKK